eukprot:jgi/Mesvir1/14533/Mv25029-RA.1
MADAKDIELRGMEAGMGHSISRQNSYRDGAHTPASALTAPIMGPRSYDALLRRSLNRAWFFIYALLLLCGVLLGLVIWSLVKETNTYDLALPPSVSSKDLTGLSIFAGSGYWNPRKDMPDVKADFQAVSAGGFVYLFGGLDDDNVVLNTTVRYDPVYHKYVYNKPMPEPRFRYGAAYLDGKIYLIGGFRDGDSFPEKCMLVYTVATDTWATGACTVDYHGDTCAAAINGKLYVAGGYGEGYVISNVTEEYDPATGAWQRVADMPTPRGDLSCAAVDNKLFVVGGYYDPSGTWRPDSFLPTVEFYDPRTGRWATGANMTRARGDKAIVVLDSNRMLVIGGETDTNGVATLVPVNDVELYYADMDRWVPKAPLATARFRFGAAAVNGVVFAFGGHQVCEAICENDICRDDCAMQGLKSVEAFLDVGAHDVFIRKNGRSSV